MKQSLLIFFFIFSSFFYSFSQTPCTSGIGVNSESFEDPAVPLGAQGPWANWVYDPSSTFYNYNNPSRPIGWIKDNLGTSGSISSGPPINQPSLDGITIYIVMVVVMQVKLLN